MKRRANGEGSVYKRPNGSWSALVTVTMLNGDKKRKCVTARTRDAVSAKMRELLEQENRQIPHTEKAWTVSEYLDYWMQEIQINRTRETTMASYKVAIKNYIRPVLGNRKLRDLSTFDVRRALDSLQERGFSARTRLEFLRILSSCLSCAMREEVIFRNVAQLVEKPKHTPKKSIIWTAEQTTKFLQKAKSHPQYIAFILLLTYGMRRGEALGLRWTDIDFENNVIHVRQQIDRISGTIMARDLKTANSRRDLPLMSGIRTALLAHAKQHGITPPPFSPSVEYSTNGTVITSRAGTPLEPRNLARCFHELTKKAGLPRIRIHDTRHMAATFLKDLNVPVKDAQLILGHANISTTLNIYQHGTPETQRTAISGIETMLLNAL